MQARPNVQYRFGTPAGAAVQVKAAPVDPAMPVPEVVKGIFWLREGDSGGYKVAMAVL